MSSRIKLAAFALAAALSLGAADASAQGLLRNRVSIEQSGRDNGAAVTQAGEANTAGVSQDGAGSLAVIRQNRNNNSGGVMQRGNGNTAVLTQNGNARTCVMQNGNGLSADVAASSGSNVAYLQTERTTLAIPLGGSLLRCGRR